MSNFEPVVSVCRHCQSYRLEGRRGGNCSQLGSLVQGAWKACALAIPPFAPSWESQEGIKHELVQLLRSQRQQLDVLEHQISNQQTIESLEACINTTEPNETSEDWLDLTEAPAIATTETS